MRYILGLLLTLSFCSVQSQTIPDNIYKTWVLSKVTYKDGSTLPDDNALKYTYIKYTFGYPDKFNSSITFYDKGTERSFEIKEGYLLMKSPEGTVINTQKIERISDNLILLQAGRQGFDDPTSLMFFFKPENVYQDSLKLTSSDIQSVYKGDTTYFECPKVYASYKGDSFLSYLYSGIADRISMHDRVGRFVATFIVSKNGTADSLQLLENIDAEFDKRFVKIFNQTKKDWKPAILNGKNVNVLMKVELKYSTSATTLPALFAEQQGIVAYNNKKYEVAEYFYDKALESEPTDKECLYRRGMCKMLLGNKIGACEDWNKAKNLGGNTTIDAVLEKFCK